MSIFISHPISTRDANIRPRDCGPLANMGVPVDMGCDMKIDIIIISYYQPARTILLKLGEINTTPIISLSKTQRCITG